MTNDALGGRYCDDADFDFDDDDDEGRAACSCSRGGSSVSALGVGAGLVRKDDTTPANSKNTRTKVLGPGIS